MNEVDLYHALSEWAKEHDPTPIFGARPTFLVTCVTEDENKVGILMGHVDPLLPKKIAKPPLDQTIAQNVLIAFKARSNALISECIDYATTLHSLAQDIGKDEVRTLLKNSADAEEFIKGILAHGKLEA